MEKNYALGLDFGTLSGRALIVDIRTGRDVADAVYNYPHGVMDTELPDGTPLKPDSALQHPQDYLDVLKYAVPEALRKAGISAGEICGVGLDFTACTMLPVDAQLEPLCSRSRYAANPRAYVKLWKHHGAQAQADRLTEIAAARGEAWLASYGGKLSPELMLPKLLETLEEDPAICAETYRFIEAGDWIVSRLVGREVCNSCMAGYKALWNGGYPSDDYLNAVHPALAALVREKLSGDILPTGTPAGCITEAGAALTGLVPGTPVAVPIIDAHSALPAAGITKAGELLMIMGTSTCHIVLGEEEKNVPGILGMVRDGILPGWYSFEAGQSCVGDSFDWFVKNCVPERYMQQAREEGIGVHALLTRLAQSQRPGQHGLLALDWFNGNRSVLADADLSGMMLGMTLQTRPEDIYRALIESTAYGTRMIIDNFTSHGVAVERLIAAGGIAGKNEMMLQIYADVTGREIRVCDSAQASALGAAIFGAAVGGAFPTVDAAIERCARIKERVYRPDPAAQAVYEQLYAEYVTLHDCFGRGANDVMKRLRALRRG